MAFGSPGKLNVRPFLPTNYKTYRAVLNAVICRQFPMGDLFRSMASSNFYNLIIGKTRSVISRPFTGASLPNHIVNIVSVGSCEQVPRITTGRIIASVADKFPLRVCSRRQVKSHTVRTKDYAFDLKRAIALYVPCALPCPAFIEVSLGHCSPKLLEPAKGKNGHWFRLNHGPLSYSKLGVFFYALR